MTERAKSSPATTPTDQGAKEPATHRLYVDEVGTHHMALASVDENSGERYLNLTGVAMRIDTAGDELHPRFVAIKRQHFNAHPDDNLVFHRKDIVQKNGRFAALRDPDRCASFDRDVFAVIESVDYSVITITIDKFRLANSYSDPAEPYTYAMSLLVERYAKHLRSLETIGDVIAEARGNKEDARLREAFDKVLAGGTGFEPASTYSRIRGPLRIERKDQNIAGLQLADLLAHPCRRAMINAKSGLPCPDDFGSRVHDILEKKKFRRSALGKIDGYGRKWVP